MTEAVNGEMGTDPSFQIQRVYLKDISLEQPNAPEILLNQGEPKLEVQVDIQANQLDDVNFHVTLIGSVTTKVDEKVLFLVEAQQSGIFDIRNMPEEQISPMTAQARPTIL
jgi:preprotein translocase subunit SecB